MRDADAAFLIVGPEPADDTLAFLRRAFGVQRDEAGEDFFVG